MLLQTGQLLLSAVAAGFWPEYWNGSFIKVTGSLSSFPKGMTSHEALAQGFCGYLFGAACTARYARSEKESH